jgi:hypothetical protein
MIALKLVHPLVMLQCWDNKFKSECNVGETGREGKLELLRSHACGSELTCTFLIVFAIACWNFSSFSKVIDTNFLLNFAHRRLVQEEHGRAGGKSKTGEPDGR